MDDHSKEGSRRATKHGAARSPFVLPEGQPPLATLPRFRVPAPTSKGGYKEKPDYSKLQSEYGVAIQAIMRHPITAHQLDKVFAFQKCFFFVAKEFPYLRAAIRPAYESFEISVDRFSRPSRNDVDALFERGPLSLPGLMRLALAFEAAIQHKNRGAITYFGLEEGNPFSGAKGKLIVPAMHSVDPPRMKEVRSVVQGTDEGFSNFVVRSGYTYLGSGFFSSYLEKGVTAGKGGRQGNYLLTAPCAKLVYSYLKGLYGQLSTLQPAGPGDWWKDRTEFPELRDLFPDDPDQFPGGGLYCKPLPVRHGNFLA